MCCCPAGLQLFSCCPAGLQSLCCCLNAQSSCCAALTPLCPIRPQPPAGGALPPQLNLAVESWLEWEQAALRPAVYGGSADALAAALQRVTDGLGGGKRFLAGSGSQPSLADLVVYATLSPLAGGLLLLCCCCCAAVALLLLLLPGLAESQLLLLAGLPGAVVTACQPGAAAGCKSCWL